MSKLLVSFDLDNLGTPREFAPPADRIIEGDIVCRNWDIDSAKDGLVSGHVSPRHRAQHDSRPMLTLEAVFPRSIPTTEA